MELVIAYQESRRLSIVSVCSGQETKGRRTIETETKNRTETEIVASFNSKTNAFVDFPFAFIAHDLHPPDFTGIRYVRAAVGLQI